MQPIGYLSKFSMLLALLGCILFVALGIDMMTSENVRFGRDFPRFWGLVTAVFSSFGILVGAPQLLACFTKGGLGLLVRDGRLVDRARWRSIPLDQITAISEITCHPLSPKPDTIRIQLASGRKWYIYTPTLRTPRAEMMKLIAAYAPRLANAPDGMVTASAVGDRTDA